MLPGGWAGGTLTWATVLQLYSQSRLTVDIYVNVLVRPTSRRWGSEVPGSRPRSWPSAARLPPAAAGWCRRELTRSFDRRSRAGIVHRLGSFSYHIGPSEPQLTSSGRATRAEWLSSTHHAKCHDVTRDRQVPGGARGRARDVLVLISEVWGGFSPEAMRFLGELAQANILLISYN